MKRLFRRLRHLIDATSSGVTMYKGIMFGLVAIILVAEIFAITNVISIDPAGLALTTVILAIVAFVTDYAFAVLFKKPRNSESWLITALILACILAPSTKPSMLASAALAALIAVASKYVLAWRGSVVFNPAAVGAFVVSVTNAAPAIWWIATPWMLVVTIPLALITLYKHRKYTMFSIFFIAAFAVLLVINNMTDNEAVVTVLKYAIISWPLLFMGSVMLTEPNTMPAARYLQYAYALIAGVVTTAQLSFGVLETSPLLAILVANLFVAFVMPPWSARLRLIGREALSHDIEEFIFAKPKNLEFAAGQYADITLEHKKTDFRGNRRRFSFASAPSEKELRITSRFVPEKGSSFKRALRNMDIDDFVRASSVRGEFTLPATGKLLFIAGGIGITPFRSMIMEIMIKKQSRDIILIYASRDKDFVYGDVLKKAKKFGVQTLLTDSRLGREELLKLVPDVRERSVYISGPDAMVTNYMEQLRDAGVKKVRTDHFTGY